MGETKRCPGCTGKDPFLEELCKKYEPIKDNLIQMLNEVQEHYGYVPTKAQQALSDYLKVPMAEIYGFKVYIKAKGKIQCSCMFRNSLFCKRITKNNG